MLRLQSVLLLAVWLPFVSYADDSLTIAVASNFKSTADEIAREFTAATKIAVRVSAASTGKLYAQIIHGAPYDVFLAADSKRPAMLENSGHAVAGSRETYAFGRLVLLSLDEELRDTGCRAALENGRYKWLAIANPATAPYGRAAKEFLRSADLWDDVSGRTVIGENVSQTLQFVATRNATLGLVAASQTRSDLSIAAVCSWDVPRTMYAEIAQQGVVLTSSKNRAAASRFLEFLRGSIATDILVRRGYGTPK